MMAAEAATAAAVAAATALIEETLAAPEEIPGDEDLIVDGVEVDEELAAMSDGEQGEELQEEVGGGAAVAQPAVPADAQGEEGGASGSNQNISRCVYAFYYSTPCVHPAHN